MILVLTSCANELGKGKESDITDELGSIFQSENFRPDFNYEPISLLYKKSPLLQPGAKTSSIDSTFWFRFDPNLKYQGKENIIIDYLSTHNELGINQSTGSINGIFYFSADKEEKRIFNISGSWLFDIELNDSTKQEAIDSFTENLFPNLKNKMSFEDGWKYEINKTGYLENFELLAPGEDENWWVLRYDINMK